MTPSKRAGYDTAFIGKWHVDGHGRSNYIPPERRLGFDTFQALECTHDYNQSAYYDGDDPSEDASGTAMMSSRRRKQRSATWKSRAGDQPFLLVLSWGPPHNPYETAPPGISRHV